MNKDIKLPSNRNFGVVFCIVFMIISLWPLLSQNEIRIWSLTVSIIFLILGLLNSKILTPFNKLWLKFGELLGRTVSPIVMAFVYFIFITPLAIIIRLFGKDLLKTKFSKSLSYWIKREKNIGSMKKQF